VARTLYEKVWDAHAVAQGPGGRTLLYIDRHLIHDGSFHAFTALKAAGRSVRRPDAAFATPDHYVPTRGRDDIRDPELRDKVETLASNARATRIAIFPVGDDRQGIVHVIGPEQGITQPGVTLVCGDSHTSTHGAFGALAFGIGASEVAHVLATQSLWQARARTMRVSVAGRLREGVHSKDIILALIAKIGAFGGTGYSLEYTGGQDVFMRSLGRGVDRAWRIKGTTAGLRAIVIPICNGTGSFVLWQLWTDSASSAQLEQWLGSVRPTQNQSPPVCAELDP